MDITFGTDGWRAILDKDFSEANVERVTFAIGKYVAEKFGFEKPVLIGYDPRNMADELSLKCAELLKDKGFNVFYSSRVVPTPVLAYNALIRNACAVMFTASHNPPEYLGMKFIPDYAGPATAEITDEIVADIDKPFEGSGSCGSIHKIDFAPKYYEHINKLIDFEKVRKVKENIIFDGLYSASIGYFDRILEDNNIPYSTLHMFHDKDFGGGMPDPKPRFLKDLILKVKSDENAVGLANDGDADRFGVINERGEYVSPNEIIAILLKYLLKKGYKGSVVKTVGSSLLIDNAAKKLGVEVIETAVGFKHVGEAMRKYEVIIGGEESGGLSIAGHIPEKDGLLANSLILEAMAYENRTLVQMQRDLHKFAGHSFINTRVDKKLDNQAEVKPVLDKFSAIDEIAGIKVSRKDFKDGVKLYLEDNSSWILVRPSGTEPLLRIYIESDSEDKIEKIKNFVLH